MPWLSISSLLAKRPSKKSYATIPDPDASRNVRFCLEAVATDVSMFDGEEHEVRSGSP